MLSHGVSLYLGSLFLLGMDGETCLGCVLGEFSVVLDPGTGFLDSTEPPGDEGILLFRTKDGESVDFAGELVPGFLFLSFTTVLLTGFFLLVFLDPSSCFPSSSGSEDTGALDA